MFGNRKLGDCKKPLVITSYDLGDDDVYLFKTPHHERLKRDWRDPAWQVALATSAAPTYFPPCRLLDNIRHVDGGIWANNPTLVEIAEAVSMFGIPLDQISVMNLGTSDFSAFSVSPPQQMMRKRNFNRREFRTAKPGEAGLRFELGQELERNQRFSQMVEDSSATRKTSPLCERALWCLQLVWFRTIIPIVVLHPSSERSWSHS